MRKWIVGCVAVAAFASATGALSLMASRPHAEPRNLDGKSVPALAPQGPASQRVEDAACNTPDKAELPARTAFFIVYKRDGRHVGFDGPEMMLPREAAARKRSLEIAAEKRFGPGVTVVYPPFGKPGSCAMLYLPSAGAKLYNMSGGTTLAYVERRRAEIIKQGGRPLTEPMCKTDAVEKPITPYAGWDYARAYGSSRDSACAAARACLRTKGAPYKMAVKGNAACSCEDAAGGSAYCTASGYMGMSSGGIRG
jgi:hypothetical protein